MEEPQVGEEVDDLLLVEEGDIEQAMVMLLEIEKTVVEGAGAAGLAAVMADPAREAGHDHHVVAADAPTPFDGFTTYFNPNLFSIPQFNLHAGYFIKDNFIIQIPKNS